MKNVRQNTVDSRFLRDWSSRLYSSFTVERIMQYYLLFIVGRLSTILDRVVARLDLFFVRMVRQRNRTIQHRGVPEYGGVQRSSGSGSRVLPGLMIYRVDRVSGELAVAVAAVGQRSDRETISSRHNTATGRFLIDGNFRIWCSASLFLPLTARRELAKDIMGGCMRTLTPVDLPCFSNPMNPAPRPARC